MCQHVNGNESAVRVLIQVTRKALDQSVSLHAKHVLGCGPNIQPNHSHLVHVLNRMLDGDSDDPSAGNPSPTQMQVSMFDNMCD